MSIESGLIAWCYGPFPAGGWPDIKIFKDRLEGLLTNGERIIADKGYRATSVVNEDDQHDRLIGEIRARHETVNKRFKQFNILCHCFRHNIALHGRCFFAVVNIVQMSLKNGEPLFEL